MNKSDYFVMLAIMILVFAGGPIAELIYLKTRKNKKNDTHSRRNT